MNKVEEHNHEGHHHNSVSDVKSLTYAFYIGIGLNAAYTVVEFIVGYSTNSLILIADASHNLSDVASLIIALIGMRLAQKAASTLYTYGYKKASILASLINAVFLILIVIKIVIESVERFSSPIATTGTIIIVTALIGVAINSISAFLFYKGQKDDINAKGAFLHLMVDALVSVGAVISGIVIHYTEWLLVDPIVSILIAIVILVSTWNLFKESLRLTIDGVPSSVNLPKVKGIFEKYQDIISFEHVHIWALSSSENALTAHVILGDGKFSDDFIAIKQELKAELAHANIQHSTLELDVKRQNDLNEKCTPKQPL